MNIPALLLVLCSGFITAIWHLLAKQSTDKFAFLWWVQVVGLIFYFPLMLHSLDTVSWSFTDIKLILGTVIIHGLSVLSLAKMYTHNDFSVAYPVARGIAPLIVMFLAVVCIGEKISIGIFFSVCVVAVGIYVTFCSGLNHNGFKKLLTTNGRWAFITGLFIAGYSAWDKITLQHVPPLAVNWAGNFGNLLFLLPLAQHNVKQEWKQKSSTLVAAGIMSSGAYLLFLIANTMAPLTRIAAVREISIVVSTVLGICFLKEPFGIVRIVGAIFILMGVVFLTLLR